VNATPSTTHDTPPQFVWPLPGTKVPNGHLNWTAWTAYQAANLSHTQAEELTAAVPSLSARPTAVRLLSRVTMQDALARFAWPLPASGLPGGRLTWAQWVIVQAKGMVLHQTNQSASERAA
jgi:hypothetical protein